MSSLGQISFSSLQKFGAADTNLNDTDLAALLSSAPNLRFVRVALTNVSSLATFANSSSNLDTLLAYALNGSNDPGLSQLLQLPTNNLRELNLMNNGMEGAIPVGLAAKFQPNPRELSLVQGNNLC